MELLLLSNDLRSNNSSVVIHPNLQFVEPKLFYKPESYYSGIKFIRDKAVL